MASLFTRLRLVGLLAARPPGLDALVTLSGSSSDNSTCGMEGKVTGCEKTDMGSCGNACCAVEISMPMSTTSLHDALISFLDDKATEGSFQHVEGTMPFHEHPSEDLRSLKAPWDFIVQGRHITSGRKYADTLNFIIKPGSGEHDSILRAFSISDLHGALGDQGQNYKTLTYVVSGLSSSAGELNVLYGCGTTPVPATLAADAQSQGIQTTGKSGQPPVPDSTCGFNHSVPDCNHEDLGSCGNACCALEVAMAGPADDTYSAVHGFLESHGKTGAFRYVSGTMPHGEHPADDLRQFNMKWKYIVQGTHTTAVRHYVDTLNFNIRTEGHSGSVLRAFSASSVHGALGDAGQNYKTLVYMLDEMNVDRAGIKVLHGCGEPIQGSGAVGGTMSFLALLPLALAWAAARL